MNSKYDEISIDADENENIGNTNECIYKVGEYYHARESPGKKWDLAILLRIENDTLNSIRKAHIRWSLSGKETIVYVSDETLQSTESKRKRKAVYDLSKEDSALRSALGIKQAKIKSEKNIKKETKISNQKETARSLKPGMLSIEIVKAAELQCYNSLTPYIKDLQPFISKKISQQLSNLSVLPNNSITSDLSTSMTTKLSTQIKIPSMIQASLRSYQADGVSWIVNQYDKGINCILADEMGLGKTLQTITFIAYLKEYRHENGPHLVVVPLSVMFNWIAECRKFCPKLKILRLHSNSPNECLRLKEKVQDVTNYDIAITSYEMIKGNMEVIFQRMIWRSVILDEGHRIKNLDTFLTKACLKLRFKLILTGTPVQNNLVETFSLLHYLLPHIFELDSIQSFEKCFSLNTTSTMSNNTTNNTNTSSVDPSNATSTTIDSENHSQERNKNTTGINRHILDAAHYMMRPFILRHVKSEVEDKLPPKLETLIQCPISKMQRFWIKALLLKDSSIIVNQVENQGHCNSNKESDWKKLQSLIAQLCKAANHPYLFPDAEENHGEATEDIVTASGKMVVLDRLLHKLNTNGHRVVIFSQYTRTLDIIGDYLELRNYQHCRLDGSTNRVMREVLINQYNKKNSPYFIFCLSTRAGGEGVNLFTADTVILFDSDWNPQVDIQAMARVHRIGQTKPVHICRLVSCTEEIVSRLYGE